MPNPVYTYILDKYMICTHVLSITFLNKAHFLKIQLNDFKYCYITVTI